jgi:hypothetical protein
MRLRLFERLGRLVSWRFGSQRAGNGGPRNPRTAGPEVGGRHRRNAGRAQPQNRVAGGARAPQAGAPPLQPPAGLPRRAPQSPPGGAGPHTIGPAYRTAGPVPRTGGGRAPDPAMPPLPRNYAPRGGGGIGRARIREAPFGAAPLDTADRAPGGAGPAGDAAAQAQADAAPRQPWYQVIGGPPAARRLTGQPGVAARAQVAPGQAAARSAKNGAAGPPGPNAASRELLPIATAHPQGFPVTADGRRNCGPLEAILWRQWDAAAAPPPPQVVSAIDRLAEFPRQLQEKLAAGLDGIYVGAGGVPDLDDMAALHGVPLPSGKATWDACAGAYGDRKIVVGTRPSPTPDVMCHEVGHALDDLDSPPGKWQSDSAEFRLIYDQCQPYIASDFHRQRGGLGRKEFFADSFAAIASAQRPALVDMLSGNTRVALRVMLYFNRRYGI